MTRNSSRIRRLAALPVTLILSLVVIVLMSAKLGGATLELFGQPPVLGELFSE